MEVNMETKVFETPALYADHHVSEVRRLLLEMNGVEDVYVSSAFRIVEVTYDSGKINESEIVEKLESAGYIGEFTIPTEAGVSAYQQEESSPTFFRHTSAYEQTRQTVSFTQNVSFQGRPLWPCPGMGVINVEALEEE
jgi:copper chaperone CopZ